MGAPPSEQLHDVWDNVCKGNRRGNELIGSRMRFNKIAWFPYEALREADAKFLLQTAQTMWLARDARRQRLLIRFRAVGFKNGEIVSRVGVLGQYKEFVTDAAGIAAATEAIVQTAVAIGQDTPRGLHGTAPRASAHALSASCLNDANAKAILDKGEALTVDAAADELLAGEIMRGRDGNVFCGQDIASPKLKLVVRDKTHASRRTTQKPETCYAFLKELVDTLFKDPQFSRVECPLWR